MGAGPIEEAVIAAQNGETAKLATPADAGIDGYFGTEPVSESSSSDPREAFIRAQHLFIEAQQDYIHNQNVPQLAAHQESYIFAQTRFITSLLGK